MECDPRSMCRGEAGGALGTFLIRTRPKLTLAHLFCRPIASPARAGVPTLSVDGEAGCDLFPWPSAEGQGTVTQHCFSAPTPVLCWTPGPTESSNSLGSPQGVCGVLSPWPSPLLPGAATGLSLLWLLHLLLLLTSKAAALPVLSSRSLGCRRAAPTPVMFVLTVPPPVPAQPAGNGQGSAWSPCQRIRRES